jgi:hypothetical protein
MRQVNAVQSVFYFGLFNDVVSSSNCVVLNDNMIEEDVEISGYDLIFF